MTAVHLLKLRDKRSVGYLWLSSSLIAAIIWLYFSSEEEVTLSIVMYQIWLFCTERACSANLLLLKAENCLRKQTCRLNRFLWSSWDSLDESTKSLDLDQTCACNHFCDSVTLSSFHSCYSWLQSHILRTCVTIFLFINKFRFKMSINFVWQV